MYELASNPTPKPHFSVENHIFQNLASHFTNSSFTTRFNLKILSKGQLGLLS